MREAGLPLMMEDAHGESLLFSASKGVVRAVYPDLWRVDLEAEDGSVFRGVPVIGPLLPELHEDGVAPAHVGYMHIRGSAHTFCWPLTHRRLLGPHDRTEGASGAGEPERRYFHTHRYIFRSGDITVRITQDNRIVFETEQGDYLQLDSTRREVRIHAPTVIIGSSEDEAGNRIEYHQDEITRVFDPLLLLGSEVGDRIEVRQGVEILLQAPLIKLTAADIVLDPTSIKLGHENATERIILGDLFMGLYNAFITLFNSHVHSNVQAGPFTSGPPTTPADSMTEAHVSDVARVSKTGF